VSNPWSELVHFPARRIALDVGYPPTRQGDDDGPVQLNNP